MIDPLARAAASQLKQGQRIEVKALDEWLPATFVRFRPKDGAFLVKVDGWGAHIATTTWRSIRKAAP